MCRLCLVEVKYNGEMSLKSARPSAFMPSRLETGNTKGYSPREETCSMTPWLRRFLGTQPPRTLQVNSALAIRRVAFDVSDVSAKNALLRSLRRKGKEFGSRMNSLLEPSRYIWTREADAGSSGWPKRLSAAHRREIFCW